MEKAIMKDPFFLSQVSEEATKEDLYLAQDLRDTFELTRKPALAWLLI